MTKLERLRGLTWMPMMLGLAVAVACGSEAGSGGTARVEISLDELNGSGQSGTAILTASGGATKVVLSLGEGTMESKPVHIHNGPCGKDLGKIAHPLTNFTDGNSETMLKDVSLESLRTGGLVINAHKAGDPKVYAACGKIPAG